MPTKQPKEPKKSNQGRPNRGTKGSMYRLGDNTLAHLDTIAGRAGETSRAEAIRIAARIVAENPALQNAGKDGDSDNSGK